MLAKATKQESTMTPERRVDVLERFSKEERAHWAIPHVASQAFRVTKGEDRFTISCLTNDLYENSTLREVASFSLTGCFLSGSSEEGAGGSFRSRELPEGQADQMLKRILEIRSAKYIGSLAKDPLANDALADVVLPPASGLRE